MPRQFGIMSDRQLPGGSELPAASSTKQYNRADLFLSGFSPDYRDLGRGPFIQAVLDVGAVLACFLIVSAVALSIPLSIFMLLMCSF
ncbi:hypothetical protein V1290_000027 [Bradyrhizobium sp. AZCC 1578]